MATHTENQAPERIRTKTAALYEQFKQNGDQERASKAALFLKKLYENEFIIAFCGHFSAGKSTMINELAGEALLPSSPIPTSANVVKIKPAAANFAKIYYHSGRPLLFQEPYEMNHVKRFAKNGDDVASIEIGHAGSALPAGVTVMDTPGVDSTDEAHRISTESSLHLADMVFYVMDYNHVQSELNFVYTKELLSHGVKLFLLINQVDKHKEEELSFEQFRQSVKKSFAAWDVEPEAFYFTSLRKPDLPYNDLNRVKQLIHRSMENRDRLLERTAEATVSRLLSEHTNWLQEQEKEQAAPFKEQLAEAGTQPVEEKEQALRLEMEKRDAGAWLFKYEEKREDVLKSVILMPAQTRELARSYLEATRPDFKVGMLFSKRKTEEERQARLQAFTDDLKKQTESQLDWHIRQMSAAWIKESGLDNAALALQAEELAVPVDETVVREAVKPGAGITGEAVLNYAEEVAALIKKRARAQSDQWKDAAMAALSDQFTGEFARLEAEHRTWAGWLKAKQELDRLYSERLAREAAVQAAAASSSLPPAAAELEAQWEREKSETILHDGTEQWADASGEQAEQEAAPPASEQPSGSVEAAASRLRLLADRLQSVPGFARFVNGALQKAERLDNRTYTIALFGAFSAGKSSFANALLGEKVLPVSPNPTTAAVNRIHPVTEGREHRTADVHLKAASVMLADVNASLGLFNESAASLEEAHQLIPGVLRSNAGEGKEKIHLSFLRAFHAGFPHYRAESSSVLTVGLDGFKQYVAEESKSCFVDAIDLYYDCDFTRLGITLVDTPGADSINARHTGVAFEYIKNADAILFVTYYNHAFSRADREFLIQLGRVKEAFELDKMFFIINAIDLAADEEELDEVKKYVRAQLLQYGIRFPRLHGVSSMLAVEEAMQGEWTHPRSGMQAFKEPFQQFLSGDLAQMAVQSAEAEADRGVQQLKRLIDTARKSISDRKQKTAELLEKQSRLLSLIEAEETDLEKKRMNQELDELVHYVKQRVFYRFSDFFKESFNPAVLSGPAETKTALHTALEELIQAVGYDLAQEMRATSLRVENHVRTLLENKRARLETKAAAIEPELLLSRSEPGTMTAPPFETAFQSVSRTSFSGTLALFKNARAFFEKNEKQAMMQRLQEQIEQLADVYLDEQKQALAAHAARFADQEARQLKQAAALDVNEQFEAWLLALEQADHVEEWEQILNGLS